MRKMVVTYGVCGAAVLMGVRCAPHKQNRTSEPGPAVPGFPAPPLQLRQLLQAPEGARANWPSLAGKLVILEFWATTCGPCRQWYPQVQQLMDELKDEPIVLISVTDEGPAVVNRYLKKHAVPGWIGLDDARKTNASYRIWGLPSMAIVDKDGTFLGWTHPSSLVEKGELLRSAARGEATLKLRDSPVAGQDEWQRFVSAQSADTASSDGPPLCLVSVRPSNGELGQRQRFDYTYHRGAVTIRNAIADTYDVSIPEIELNCSYDDDVLYEIIVQGCSRKRVPELVRTALKASFDLTITSRVRPQEVYVLQSCGNKRPEWKPAKPRMKYDRETGLFAPTQELMERMKAGEEFFMAMGSTSNLALNLSNAIGHVVVDEVETADGYYLFYFPIKVREAFSVDVDTAKQALKNRYGLCLHAETRPVEQYVVDCAKKGS